MKYCCRYLLNHRLRYFFVSLFCLSFPASSASFSFVEFNIAFILGLSLPVLIISSLLKPLVKIKRRYPTLLTLFLFAMLYAFAHLQDNATLMLLTFSTGYLMVTFLWPLNTGIDAPSTRTLFTTRASYVCAAAYLAIIWSLPDIDAYLSWLVFGVAILLLSGFRMANFLHGAADITVRVIVRWLVILSFVVGTYLWLNARIELSVLLIVTVSGYVVTILSGSWLLVQGVLEKMSTKYQANMVSLDDVYVYTHDHATNLPSHQFALDKFEQLIKEKNDRRYAAIVFRPINFEQVNTVLGRHNSDILLLQFAFALSQYLADKRHLLSFDGEQQPVRIARLQSLHFLLVIDLTDNHHPEQDVIKALCQNLTDAVPEAMSFKSFSLNFEMAFGVSIVGEHGVGAVQTVAFAEDALLQAEKNQELVHFFDQQSLFYTERHLRQMEKLKQDIIEDRLHWHVQPQINLVDKNIRGFELLVSWQNSDVKQSSLPEFIELAEQSGEVYLLTKQMIKQAFKLLFLIQKLGIYQSVSVNLSSKDLLEPDLADYIEKQSTAYNIPTKYLVIELSEKILLSGYRAKDMVDQLKALGVGIAIDDFSGSYEALRYMRKMAVSQVKIDCGQLIINQENVADKAIINALVNLAKKMALPLVGIGIDNTEIMNTFIKMGGELGQGKLIKHALSIDDVGDWVNFWLKEYPHLKE